MSANDKQVGGNHYQGAVQHWDYVTANNIPYLEACAIKYIVRHRDKNGIDDINKAIHFLEKLKEVNYPMPDGLKAGSLLSGCVYCGRLSGCICPPK